MCTDLILDLDEVYIHMSSWYLANNILLISLHHVARQTELILA